MTVINVSLTLLFQENEPTYETLHKMEYLDAVYHEALRYYPPVVT